MSFSPEQKAMLAAPLSSSHGSVHFTVRAKARKIKVVKHESGKVFSRFP